MEQSQEFSAGLDALLVLCSQCEDSYLPAKENMRDAVKSCSNISAEFRRLAREMRQKEAAAKRNREIVSETLSSVMALSGALMQAGQMVKNPSLVKGSLVFNSLAAVAKVASDIYMAMNPIELEALAAAFESAAGQLEPTKRSLEGLLDSMKVLRLHAEGMAKNLSTAQTAQRSYQSTLRDQQRTIESLMGQLRASGIDPYVKTKSSSSS